MKYNSKFSKNIVKCRSKNSIVLIFTRFTGQDFPVILLFFCFSYDYLSETLPAVKLWIFSCPYCQLNSTTATHIAKSESSQFYGLLTSLVSTQTEQATWCFKGGFSVCTIQWECSSVFQSFISCLMTLLIQSDTWKNLKRQEWFMSNWVTWGKCSVQNTFGKEKKHSGRFLSLFQSYIVTVSVGNCKHASWCLETSWVCFCGTASSEQGRAARHMGVTHFLWRLSQHSCAAGQR